MNLEKPKSTWSKCCDSENIFAPKIWQKYCRFLLKVMVVFAKSMIITMVSIFFTENWQKSKKIVIITLSPGIWVFDIWAEKNSTKLFFKY
jgi:hypothetical protein